jgi:hypothetical protein
MLQLGIQPGKLERRDGSEISIVIRTLQILTAVFQFTGAGAVIGVFWKIWLIDAKKFAQVFYESLLQAHSG